MQLSSSLSGGPVAATAVGSTSGAGTGSNSRTLNATTQRVPDSGVIVELSPAAEAVLSGSGYTPVEDTGVELSGNPLAPVGLQDAMADFELYGIAEESGEDGVFQLYENPAFEEAQEADRTAKDDVPVVGLEEDSAASEPAELSEDERVVVEKLKARDSAVRAHEMAHVSAAGGLAGAPVFSFQTGPDGRRYAIGGSVTIDTSPERSAEDTIAKAQRIRSAALAPADPSAADRAVASSASRMESQARQALASQQAVEAERAMRGSSDAAASSPAVTVDAAPVVDLSPMQNGPKLDLPEISVSSVIPGGISTLASERNEIRAGPASATLRSPVRRLGSFSGGSAAVAQLYTPTDRSLEAAFLRYAS